MAALIDTAYAKTNRKRQPRASKPANRQLPKIDKIVGARSYIDAFDKLGIVSVTTLDGQIIHVNDEFTRISKYSRDELVGQTHRIVNSGFHRRAFFKGMHDKISKGEPWRAPIKNRARDGSFYWVDALVVPLKDRRRKNTAYLSFQFEITKAVETHIELQERTATLQGVMESFPGGISVFDRNLRLILCNDKVKNLVGYPDELFSNGLPTFEEIVRSNAKRGEYGPGDIEALVAERMQRAAQAVPHQLERRRPNGTHLEIRGTPLTGGGFVTTYVDITERKKDQDTIARLAHHDALTGLPNRVLFQDRIRHALARVRRGDTLALHCLDLDRFKSVNDTLGHPVGDALLKAVAGRLQNVVRESDTVARLGGDEFAIIQVGPQSPADVEAVAKRIIAALAQPFKLGENIISIGTSIGITIAPEDGDNADQLMKNADLALYRTKSAGRGAFGYFEQELQSRQAQRHEIATGLQEALETDGFELHYQPTVNVQTRRVVGCEALIRWSHPQRGLVPASEFIPIAEEAGLINKIGDWVLKRACRDAKRWPENVWVAVNISAAQLRGHDLVDKVSDALGDMPASRLMLEITESLLVQDKETAKTVMDRLRAIGVRFALDDFGTGFSSLSYLQVFPFDKIKIDRSFMAPIGDQKRSAALRRAIVQLGHTLEMTTVAEGVETEEQFAQLANEGCVEAQGYLFSRPVPEIVVSNFFERKL